MSILGLSFISFCLRIWLWEVEKNGEVFAMFGLLIAVLNGRGFWSDCSQFSSTTIVFWKSKCRFKLNWDTSSLTQSRIGGVTVVIAHTVYAVVEFSIFFGKSNVYQSIKFSSCFLQTIHCMRNGQNMLSFELSSREQFTCSNKSTYFIANLCFLPFRQFLIGW